MSLELLHTLAEEGAALFPMLLIPSKVSWGCQVSGKFFLILR